MQSESCLHVYQVLSVRIHAKIVSVGIPEDAGKRALCWKLLLNYMPLERKTWSSFLAKKREIYKNYIGKHKKTTRRHFVFLLKSFKDSYLMFFLDL